MFTEKEIALLVLNKLLGRSKSGKKNLSFLARTHRLKNRYFKNGKFILGEVQLPPLCAEDEYFVFGGGQFYETFYVYLEQNDDYREDFTSGFYEFLGDGPYCFKNNTVDVCVEPGDTVFDIGSWAGDFAAYASCKKAIVYAFEPNPELYQILLKTAELNGNIFPIDMGLGDLPGRVGACEREAFSPGFSLDRQQSPAGDSGIEVTTVDAFVKDNGLSRVDFIKADIEGYERYMLQGAKETLRRFAPKLAICTYHLPDDPEVLASLIREANPDYRIVQKQRKLYASVPK